jgi:hypothetical protein
MKQDFVGASDAVTCGVALKTVRWFFFPGKIPMPGQAVGF